MRPVAGGVRVRCPAKLNLDLKILGRRDDGHHELRTTFQTIDLWDVIDVSGGAERLEVDCDDAGVPSDRSNLAARAVAAWCAEAGHEVPSWRVSIRKRIPPGGGLGGGSSDAAGMLVACEALSDRPLGRARLLRLASGLGADVAFFLTGGTAVGTGRGECIAPVAARSEPFVLLGFPPFAISTPEVYARFARRLTPECNGVSVRAFSGKGVAADGDADRLGNDLEPIAFEMRPSLLTFRDELLSSGARVAAMSGSGSTMFGFFDDAEGLDRAVSRIADRFGGWRTVRTRTVQAAVRVDRVP